MAERQDEEKVLRHARQYPGYHTVRRPWRWRTRGYQAAWRLWRQGRIRVDCCLRVWPAEVV